MPHFFTRLYFERKRAAISKLTYIWTPSSRSYIVFALGISIFGVAACFPFDKGQSNVVCTELYKTFINIPSDIQAKPVSLLVTIEHRRRRRQDGVLKVPRRKFDWCYDKRNFFFVLFSLFSTFFHARSCKNIKKNLACGSFWEDKRREKTDPEVTRSNDFQQPLYPKPRDFSLLIWKLS